jgi:hypothetical protein
MSQFSIHASQDIFKFLDLIQLGRSRALKENDKYFILIRIFVSDYWHYMRSAKRK